MDRDQLMLVSSGVGVIIISITVLMVFIAFEIQILLVEHFSIFNEHYSLRPIVRSHGVDFIVLSFVVLGILILLAAFLQTTILPWLTSFGLGAFITTSSFLVDDLVFF